MSSEERGKLEPPPRFPLLQVSEILDKTTLVVVGSGIDSLREGETLVVVAVGAPVGSTGVPLVVPKAKLEVTSVLSQYAIVRPEAEEVEERPISTMLAMTAGRKYWRRPALDVDEKDLRGNPARTNIARGDPVLRLSDVKAYSAFLGRKTNEG